MKPVILKVEWLLTRHCNLKCHYCKIIDSKSLKHKELSYERVIAGVNRINKDFPGVPIIFFGGEPTVKTWLPNLVSYCEKIGQKYAIISNSVYPLKNEDYLKRLIDAGLSNWSVSIDTLKNPFLNFFHSDTKDSYTKSMAGFKLLKKLRDMGVKNLS